MPLIYLIISFIFLLLLIMRWKVNAFFALILAAVLTGVLYSMPAADILKSITSGIGQTIGSLILIIVFGAILGKVLEDSGAAYRITYGLVEKFGRKNLPYAILVAGFVIGLPMMYNASFLVLIPILYTFSRVAQVPLLQLGIPLSASLSVAHAYLPPHPAPVVVAEMYKADINIVFLYGLIFAIPAIFICGVILPKFFKKLVVQIPQHLSSSTEVSLDQAPSFWLSILCALFPFLLMALSALSARSFPFLAILGSPEVALGIAVILSISILHLARGSKMDHITKITSEAVSSIAMIILVIAAGGAFKQVLTDSGASKYIGEKVLLLQLNPIVLSWTLAALIRLMIGSATVATITAAGILAPLVTSGQVSAELMVLSTGSGSLMFSHMNDIGFWMFKEYYNVSVIQTFQIWTVMECLVGIIGLAGCLIAAQII